MEVIGYTYEADAHCVSCTQKRKFKLSLDCLNKSNTDSNGICIHAIDNEGNLIHPIFSTDEQLEPLHCGDCHEEIQ